MLNSESGNKIIASAIIAFGLFLAGLAIAVGIESFHTANRYVTVKGLSEKEVQADTANYFINFVESGGDLQRLYKKINSNADTVREFFIDNGVTESEIKLNSISARDSFAGGYVNNSMREDYRYVVSASFNVKSKDVFKIEKLVSKKGSLISKGINIDNDRVEYHFTKLNEIKPDMISEAIAAARESAERFADDSDSELAGIRRANQGSVIIRDINAEYGNTANIDKKVRVVSTVVYNLED